MQKHVAQLYETFGRSAGEDLKTLGFQNAAEQLQQAVAACKRKQIPETLEYAKVVVDEAWFRLQTQGWDHPAWREAYCLGQLCLACAYNCLDRDAAERISTGNPDSQDRGPGNRSEASQSEAEEASQSEAAAESVQPTPAPCQTADSKQAQPLRSHIAANAAADAAQQQPCLSAMRVLDLATIMGAPSAMVQPLVTVIEPKAQQYLQATLAHQTDNASCSHQLSDAEPADVPKLDSARNIARQQVQGLSPNGFKKLFWKTDTPVIITGDMNKWKAMHKWQSVRWWIQTHGHRTVPVELGRDGDSTWKEATMSLHDFMTHYVRPSLQQDPGASTAYIAQHPLFEQLPDLTADFDQPSLMAGETEQSNAWIGTAGTVTPLHFDSYDNFLCQVAGYKYIRLYSRQQTPCLYVDSCDSSSAKSATRAQRNISAVNIEYPNLEQHPRFAAAQFTQCVLAPGEMLFIPAKYWHYVRSLSPAISINFWY